MVVGKRIQLRAIEYEDLPLIVKWRNDPEVYQYFYEHEPLSLVMQRGWFEKYLVRSDEKLWIVEAKDTHEAIGTVGLVHLDWRNRKGEWGRLLIYPDEYRHGGYGSEVESLILRYFFDHMNMNRLQCEVFLENESVWQLHQIFGFKREGLFRQYIFKDGKYRDVVYLAMLREEYLSGETQTRITKYLD
jgi:UDP-4-amino-4,6-dideoxy-N-acetyl-beta-L-altrosamine N-acetyltransferase